MINKKNVLLTIAIVFVLIVLAALPLQGPSKQNNQEGESTQKTDKLSLLKEKLTNGYNLENITLEYHPNSDTIIVFYKEERSEAENKTQKFILDEGVKNLKDLKIEYIGEEKDKSEPPAGYFR